MQVALLYVNLTIEIGLIADAKPATACTEQVNSAVYSILDFDDTSEYDNAVRGLIEATDVLEFMNAKGNLASGCVQLPGRLRAGHGTVNPSLWESTHRDDADVSITCTENALLYIALLARSMNQGLSDSQDFLHWFTLGQLIHQLVQPTQLQHQRIVDLAELYAADRAGDLAAVIIGAGHVL